MFKPRPTSLEHKHDNEAECVPILTGKTRLTGIGFEFSLTIKVGFRVENEIINTRPQIHSANN